MVMFHNSASLPEDTTIFKAYNFEAHKGMYPNEYGQEYGTLDVPPF